MTSKKEPVERRKHKRFEVPTGVFVALKPDDTKLGEVINISMGGLAFRYLASKEPSKESCKLDIFSDEEGFHLNDVVFETVTDFGTHQIPLTSVTMRQSGVKFGELTHHQMSQLEDIIQNHTIREAI